ncbi:MAG: carboxypeptidase-like regulatory domain-containing protein [Bacteroidota bacterium]
MKTKLLFILLFSISLASFAQKYTLTGTIYDEDNNVLADANVVIKNSDQGVITNEKGQFSIEVAPKDVLKISFLGFESQKIVITHQKELEIILMSKWEVIDAVEVVAQGISVCKSIIYCNFAETSLEEKAPSEFKRIQEEVRLSSLFPNPSASGLFQLQLNTKYTKLTLEVFNMNGQLIQSQTHNKLSKIPQINLSKQPKGIYLIRIVADGNVLETKKAVRS